MATYTKLKDSDLAKVAADYQLQISNLMPIGGATNSNYVLETDRGKLMFTLVEDRSTKETKQVIKMLKWLKKHGFKSNQVLLGKNGKAIQHLEDKPYYIKNYIKGKIPKRMGNRMQRAIGAEIARLHQIPTPDFLPQQHFYESPALAEVIGSRIDTEYEEWLEKRRAELKASMSPTLPKGFTHGDIFKDNILFGKSKQYRAIIDFEEASNSPFVFDLGMSIVGLCLMKSGRLALQKVLNLVKGYQKVRPLLPEEKRQLQLFAEYAALATSNWRYWKYNVKNPTPERKDWHWKMVETAKDIRAIPEELFYRFVFK